MVYYARTTRRLATVVRRQEDSAASTASAAAAARCTDIYLGPAGETCRKGGGERRSRASTMPNYTATELRQRTCADRLLLAVDGRIYNVTDFAGRHPGGVPLLQQYAGQDVTEALRDAKSHTHTATAYHVLKKYYIGDLVDDSDSAVRHRVSTE